ncbi:MAG: hypothetical protein LUD39_01825 [Opitutae bacterium]|nr:hypothetical protein [Opitutae bacterium]
MNLELICGRYFPTIHYMSESKETNTTNVAGAEKPRKQKPVFTNDSYFGFATYMKTDDGDWKFMLNWRRVIAILVVLVIIGYCAFATLRYMIDKYKREWDGASFATSFVLPFSEEARDERNKALGEFYMAKARESKTPGEVVAYVRTALGYDETNPDARISFSYLIFYQRMVKDAIDFLAEGLPVALDHKEYPTYFVRRCLSVTEDLKLVESVKECMPKLEEMIAQVNEELKDESLSDDAKKDLKARLQILESNRLVLAVGAVQASILRGYFAQAKELLDQYGLEKYVPGKVLAAQILWENGSREDAITYLDRAVDESRGDPQIVLLRALYLSAMGRTSQARYGLTLAAVRNNSPEIRIRLISALGEESGNAAMRREMIEDYIRRYGDNAKALLLLSQYATEQNDMELLTRIYNIANEKIFVELPRFEMHYLEALIVSGKPKEALLMMDKLGQENMAWVEANSAGLDGLKTIAYFKAGDETLGKLHLERTLSNRSISAAQLVIVGKRLAEIGRPDEALSAYETAFHIENYNNMVLVALVDYALKKRDVDALMRYLPRLVDSRRPPRGLLERAKRFLASDRMMFLPEAEKYYDIVSEMLKGKDGVKLFSESDRQINKTLSVD